MMLRAIWLVARREYIGYVTAWGFWLGLILTPIGLLAGAILPSAIQSNQPIRYFVVVDQQDEFKNALDEQLNSWRAGEALGALQQHIAPLPPKDQRAAIDAFERARALGKSPEQALSAANAPETVQVPPAKFIKIRSPSDRVEEIQRIMVEEQALNGPEGMRPLFAALIVRRDQVGAIEAVDYISRDVVVMDLRYAAEGALKRLAREALLNRVGLSFLDIKGAEANTPPVITQRFGEIQDTDAAKVDEAAEVTLTDRAPFIAASLIAMVLWLLIFSVVNFLLTGTIEERSNKIFDSLLTCVRLTDLLFGKLLGVLMLSLTLVGVWAVLALWGGLQFADQMGPAVIEFLNAALAPRIVVPALMGFLTGYVMYGVIFLAMGSLCDTIQEAQTLITPLIIFLMIPLGLIVVAIGNPDSEVLQILSWAPFFTPFLMILRAPLDPPIWETLGQLMVTLAFSGFIVWMSARIYRAGAVHGAGMNEARGWFVSKLPGKRT